jgi:DNA-binding SARP family transcriptional activator/DNA-binding XRE family transcriptional regulator
MAGKDNGKSWIRIGTLVKRYREEQRVTQRELAAAAGMSLGALRDLEQGRTLSPRWGSVEGLVAVLGLGQPQRAELAQAWRTGAEDSCSRRAGMPRRPGVRIAILGPLAAWRDGAPLLLGSARQRAVLGVLALHAGTGVHRDVLIDLLWDDWPPPTAVSKVQSYVSWLRQALGARPARDPGPELITTAGGRCYALNTDAVHLDLLAFDELTRQARQAAVQSDPALACERFEQALRLWNADVAADIELLSEYPARVEATCRRAAAVISYAELAAAAGAYPLVLPHLRDLCVRDPLNEHAHACLMTALAATGQQAAALEVFTSMRRRLDAELGLTPSVVLVQAHAEVLRQQVGGIASGAGGPSLNPTFVGRRRDPCS